MGKLSRSIGKTKRYLKRNGFKKTVYAVTERVSGKNKKEVKGYTPLTEEELLAYKSIKYQKEPLISIVVPAYETDAVFFTQLMDSVCTQTYENWELIIADASEGQELQELTEVFVSNFRPAVVGEKNLGELRRDLRSRIKYHHLESNEGISDNTNKAIEYATGEYIGLLDHDDMLTYNALSEMVNGIEEHAPILLYSDEDKTDKLGKSFFEPHLKRKFNLDLILSNNYICHFTLIKSEVLKELKLRKEYDGAQDYDLFLRVVERCRERSEIVHIPKILYHWRTHEGSTASDTEAKSYAYENGKKAVEDFCRRKGWNVTVEHTSHLGFYRVEFVDGILETRPEVGAVGGPVYRAGKIAGGAMKPDGSLYYKGLSQNYSGYMHRASMLQDVYALDIRNMELRPELCGLMDKYKEEYPRDDVERSIALSKELRERGYLLVYDPRRSEA